MKDETQNPKEPPLIPPRSGGKIVSAEPASARILQGDAMNRLGDLDDESVDCCVTSPPYWGLRDYGVEGQLGLEARFEDYISKICDIFDEVKRVLKDEGTCWVVIGDTYSSGSDKSSYKNSVIRNDDKPTYRVQRKQGFPDKTLLQMPSRFAIEMCERGWILRNEIIWHKPNCMPSSVKDRFTVDFEKVFFFVKQKSYYFEQQYEPFHPDTDVWYRRELREGKSYDCKKPYKGNTPYAKAKAQNPSESKARILESMRNSQGRNKRCVWTIPTSPSSEPHFAMFPEDLVAPMIKAGCPEGGVVLDPFSGMGTTGIVARKLGRRYIGIELNSEYAGKSERRIEREVGMFA